MILLILEIVLMVTGIRGIDLHRAYRVKIKVVWGSW